MMRKILDGLAYFTFCICMVWVCCLDLQDPYPFSLLLLAYGPAVGLMAVSGLYIKWREDCKKVEEEVRFRRLERQRMRASMYRY